jgi:hypothetical protein
MAFHAKYGAIVHKTASRTMAPSGMSLISEVQKPQPSGMRFPVQAWFCVTEFPSKTIQVQTSISNNDAVAIVDERIMNLNSSLSEQDPLRPLMPGLQIEMRKPVQNEMSSSSHLEHLLTMHIPYSSLIDRLITHGMYENTVTTMEDNNMKWTLEVALVAREVTNQSLEYPGQAFAYPRQHLDYPTGIPSQMQDLYDCKNTVTAYQALMEQNGIPLETVQQMVGKVMDFGNARSEACAAVLGTLIQTKGQDFVERYPTRMPMMWSRKFGDNAKGVPVSLDNQQTECLLRGASMGGHQDFVGVLTLNAFTSLAVEIAQGLGADVHNPASVHEAVAKHVRSTSTADFRTQVLTETREQLAAVSKYTSDPSWKLQCKATPLLNQNLPPLQSPKQAVDALLRIEPRLEKVTGTGTGEDQSIPGFNEGHWMQMQTRSCVTGNGQNRDTATGTQMIGSQLRTSDNVTGTQLTGTQLITLDIDCEDFANLLCLTTQGYKYRPFVEIQQSVASICELMPDSLKVMRPTFDLMFLALKGQQPPARPSNPVDLQKLDSACLLRHIDNAVNQQGVHSTFTTALLAKAPSIGQEQHAGTVNENTTGTNFAKFNADVFDQWWREQPLNGHAIVTSGTTKEVMTINTGVGDVVLAMLHGTVKVIEGTGPADQISDSNSQRVTMNLDKKPSTTMRMDLQKKIDRTGLNLSMAGNIKSSVHVSELQNVLNFQQFQHNVQNCMQDNTEGTMPLSSYTLAARQTFSLNCTAGKDIAAEKEITANNSFYLTTLSNGGHGVAYSLDLNKLRASQDPHVDLFFGAPMSTGLVTNSETLFFSGKMDREEERRLIALGALTGLTMLRGEKLIRCLPEITPRAARLHVRLDTRLNTFIPLTPAEMSMKTQFKCGIVSQFDVNLRERDVPQHMECLVKNAMEITGCNPSIRMKGFTSSVDLRYA